MRMPLRAPCIVRSFVAVLALACAAAGDAHDFAASVVRVRALSGDGTPKLGSGVVIGHDQVATACHVTRGAERIEVVKGVFRRSVERQTGSAHHDVCVLHLGALSIAPAIARPSRSLRPGEAVVAIGFEGGDEAVAMHGEIAGLYAYEGGNIVRTGARFDSGSSGGALFDVDGRLVGILAFRARAGERLRFILPSEWLAAESPIATAPLTIGAGSDMPAFWERSRDERPAFLGVALQEAAGATTR
jgi:S1-C subfamily serine protease